MNDKTNPNTLRWWIADPNTGYPSVRKIAGYACILILLEVTQAAIFGLHLDTGVLISLLSAATAGCGIYAATSPSKQINGNGNGNGKT
jgi:hypothetical protein